MPRYANHRRGFSAAAGIRYDCSILPDDETVFLVPPDHGRRFLGDGSIYGPSLVLREDRTVILDLPRRISGGEGLPEEAIAKHVGSTVNRGRRNAYEDCGVCVVCQDNLGEGNGGIATLDCAHEFHAPCIGRWLRLKNTCPLCKATVVLASSQN